MTSSLTFRLKPWWIYFPVTRPPIDWNEFPTIFWSEGMGPTPEIGQLHSESLKRLTPHPRYWPWCSCCIPRVFFIIYFFLIDITDLDCFHLTDTCMLCLITFVSETQWLNLFSHFSLIKWNFHVIHCIAQEGKKSFQAKPMSTVPDTWFINTLTHPTCTFWVFIFQVSYLGKS